MLNCNKFVLIYKHLHAHLWTINLHVVKSQVVTLNDIFYVHIRFIVLSIFISDKNNKMCMQRNISDTWVTILELNFHTFINIYSFTRVLLKRLYIANISLSHLSECKKNTSHISKICIHDNQKFSHTSKFEIKMLFCHTA